MTELGLDNLKVKKVEAQLETISGNEVRIITNIIFLGDGVVDIL